MQGLTFERFEEAIDETLDTYLVIASHAKAGVGNKRVTYNPSTRKYDVYVELNGQLYIDIETKSKLKAFEQFQSVDLERVNK